jgi:hypothetical protein
VEGGDPSVVAMEIDNDDEAMAYMGKIFGSNQSVGFFLAFQSKNKLCVFVASDQWIVEVLRLGFRSMT